MHIRQRDVVVGAVLVLYIVFFALSPPAAVRTVLSHPVGVAASFGVAIYTTLYYSRPIGALLIVALLASMTRTMEHMSGRDWSATAKYVKGDSVTYNGSTYTAQFDNDSIPPEGHTNSQLYWKKSAQSAVASASISSGTWSSTKKYVKGDSVTYNGSTYTAQFNNDSIPPEGHTNSQLFWKKSVTPSATVSTPPITTPSAPAATTPAVAKPPVATKPTAAKPPAAAPKPVMACNIENFAPF